MNDNDCNEPIVLSSTIGYLSENEHAFSLPLEGYAVGTKSREFFKPTVCFILKSRFFNLTIGTLRYLFAVSRRFEEIKKLTALKSTKKGKRAIVLGNGPSLGYLDNVKLKMCQVNGDEIFGVNVWTSTHLKCIAPNYYVISDGITLANEETAFGSALSDKVKKQNAELTTFLNERKDVRIFCPLVRVRELAERFSAERVTGFVDHEMRGVTSNIDPRFPRGYVSMTLFKTLAIAIHMGYDEIFLLGMDNTYPRDMFCDNKNKPYRLQRHAGGRDTIFDQSAVYPNIAVWLQDLADLFSDLHRCFKGYSITNLDPYSLTDAFPKIDSLASLNHVLNIVPDEL